MWAQTQMRLFVVTGFEEDTEDLKKTLTAMMKSAGMKAQVHVVQMQAEDAPRYTHLGTPTSNAGGPEDSMSSPTGTRRSLTLGEEAHEWLDTLEHTKQKQGSVQPASHRKVRESETSEGPMQNLSDDGMSSRSMARAGSINQVRN